MKNKDQVKPESKAVFYAVLLESFRKAALDCGYALALHGSMVSDMDLVAIPWTEDAKTEEELVKAINDCLGKTIWSQHNFTTRSKGFHNRIIYSLSIMGDWYIDLSILPLSNK